jgi:hypothetical protein
VRPAKGAGLACASRVARNVTKHEEVTFEEAATVLRDPLAAIF